jgi:hypothetical protein
LLCQNLYKLSSSLIICHFKLLPQVYSSLEAEQSPTKMMHKMSLTARESLTATTFRLRRKKVKFNFLKSLWRHKVNCPPQFSRKVWAQLKLVRAQEIHLLDTCSLRDFCSWKDRNKNESELRPNRKSQTNLSQQSFKHPQLKQKKNFLLKKPGRTFFNDDFKQKINLYFNF